MYYQSLKDEYNITTEEYDKLIELLTSLANIAIENNK